MTISWRIRGNGHEENWSRFGTNVGAVQSSVRDYAYAWGCVCRVRARVSIYES
jgi:hypothetical protein